MKETVVPQALLSRQAFAWGVALAGLAGLALAPAPGMAAQRSVAAPQDLSAVHLAAVHLVANAGNPYGNVDRRNDAGNDTGDSEVERLNEGQLDRNYRGPYTYRYNYRPPVAPPAYPPPPGYAPPPGNQPGYPPPLGGPSPGY